MCDCTVEASNLEYCCYLFASKSFQHFGGRMTIARTVGEALHNCLGFAFDTAGRYCWWRYCGRRNGRCWGCLVWADVYWGWTKSLPWHWFWLYHIHYDNNNNKIEQKKMNNRKNMHNFGKKNIPTKIKSIRSEIILKWYGRINGVCVHTSQSIEAGSHVADWFFLHCGTCRNRENTR